ncbi:hypothetical protein ACFLXT_02695 [Chloroflexota bacterium]
MTIDWPGVLFVSYILLCVGVVMMVWGIVRGIKIIIKRRRKDA